MKPPEHKAKNNNKKFDIDLARGQIMEDKILHMFENAKIEVKSEMDRWANTGNICIEHSSWGRPSGITSTEADYWFHNLCLNGEIVATLVFKVDKLRHYIENVKQYSVRGGDGNASEMYLVKLSTLFKHLGELNKNEEGDKLV